MNIKKLSDAIFINTDDELFITLEEIEEVKIKLKNKMKNPAFDKEFRRIVEKSKQLKIFEDKYDFYLFLGKRISWNMSDDIWLKCISYIIDEDVDWEKKIVE